MCDFVSACTTASESTNSSSLTSEGLIMCMASSGTEMEKDSNLCGIESQWVDSSCPYRNHDGAKRPIFHALHKALATIERVTHADDKPIKASHRKGNLKSHSFSLSVLRPSPGFQQNHRIAEMFTFSE